MPPTSEQLQMGPWRLGRRLGIGGHGVVYEASDGATDAAVKVVALPRRTRPEQVHARLDRLVPRLQALRDLRHSGLPALLDWGADVQGARVWLAMERLNGPTLDALPGPDEVAWVRRLAHALLDALAVMHARGVLHGDIKPANVLLEPDGRVVLVDPALPMEPHEDTPVAADVAMGSPAWMSPEVLQGGPTTAAADVYALGQTLWERWTGGPAFVVPGRGPGRLLTLLERKRAVDGLDPPPGDPVLADLLHAMTRRDPADRPTAARALARVDAAGSTGST